MLKKAIEIATEAHKGQFDKGNNEYINHPIAVASKVECESEKIVAYLHDVIEDSDVTLEQLNQWGFPDEIVFAIDCITKKDEPYDEYLLRIKANKIARKVKLADLEHNMDVSRIINITDKDIKRLEKYRQAKSFLES